MMRTTLIRIALILAVLVTVSSPVSARDGDTLEPIEIDAPLLETWPENLLNDNDQEAISQRVREARVSGVPLAVRIVDVSLPEADVPFHIRQYMQDDFSQPLSPERLQVIAESWAGSEAIETSEGADDGFLLLVLVPEDRSQTQAVWWAGPNALPINGLTKENIQATHGVMDAEFAAGNMPNGVFVGLLEFSYNIQFGTPERLERSTLQDALHTATIPMAIATALAGLAIPVLALWLSRRIGESTASPADLTPWEAGALHLGRARAEIPAAMLLDAVHQDQITPVSGGGLKLKPGVTNAAIDALRPYANDDGVIDTQTMYEIESVTLPVREEIEAELARQGAMTSNVEADRNRMLLAIGIAAFLIAITTVPAVKAMSAVAIFAMGIAIIGIAAGWWWLAYRRYTTSAGEEMLATWLESASEPERSAFDLVVHQGLLVEQDSGPDTTPQTRLLRQLRGLGSA